MQHENKSSKRNSRGYYIALFLCLIAVGASGLVFYRNSDPVETSETSVQNEPTQPQKVQTAKPSAPNKNIVKDAISKNTVEAAQAKPLQVSAPIEGDTINAYAMDHLSYNETTKDWRTHAGIDIAAEAGEKVFAAADGVVSAVYDDDLLGKTVVVTHANNAKSYYCNLADEVSVRVGEEVNAQSVLGTVGETAMVEVGAQPHLHFAVFQNAQYVDPEAFLSANGNAKRDE